MQPGAQGRGRASWLPQLATEGYAPPPGEALQRLVIEIDSGTESQRQLIQRARGWRARWEAMPHPPATDTLILWLTTGSIERLNTIWEAWIGHAFLPAFFATQSDLTADTPQWRPWEPLRFDQGRYRWLWRDLYGPPALAQALGDERTPVAQRSAPAGHAAEPGSKHRGVG